MTGNSGKSGKSRNKKPTGTGSGGAGTGAGGGLAPALNQCQGLNFLTAINSVSEGMLSNLPKLACMEVALDISDGRTKPVAKYKGVYVGAITSEEATRLIECLKQNVPFRAVVTEINIGSCTVRVSAGVCP